LSLAAGTRLGPYEILGLLGAGGMGEVYRARDDRLGREVAIKVLPAGLSQDPDRLRRFEQEARAAGSLNHPHILAVYDVGNHDGSPYVVSELLEGETLRERIGGGALPVRKSVEIGVQMARGLAAAHEKGIVHRNLKPEVDPVFWTTGLGGIAGLLFIEGSRKDGEARAKESQPGVQGEGGVGGAAGTGQRGGDRPAVRCARERGGELEEAAGGEHRTGVRGGAVHDSSERESELLKKIGELTVERDFLARGLGRLR